MRTSTCLFASLALVAACGDNDAPPHDPLDLEVAIDVLPGTWPNQVAGGTIEVAILARGGVDATSVDPSTLVAHDYLGTVEVPIEPELREEDVDGDGALDAIATLALTPELAGENTRLIVTGETAIGDRLTGWDMILDPDRPTLELPELRGPHPVGVVEYEWTDTSRITYVGPSPNDPRRLKAQVLYPAELGAGAQPSPAFLGREEGVVLAEFFLPTYLGIVLPGDFHEYIGSRVVAEAPLADGGPWPVLLFTHGGGTPAPVQLAIVSEVASHGFVVVSISHPFYGGPVVFEDGEVIEEYLPNGPPDTISLDQRFVLDQVEALAASDERFAGSLDLARAGVFGFSMGGIAAVETVATDARFRAGANIDGSVAGPYVPIDQAFLMINSLDYQPGPGDDREGLLDAVLGPAYQLTFTTARHLNFCDCVLQEEMMRFYDPTITLPGVGTIDRELAFEILDAYLVAFFKTHVAGEPDPLLEQASPWPDVELVPWT
jgi:pimeloyl-ACP methyl ester carboxylesterase